MSLLVGDDATSTAPLAAGTGLKGSDHLVEWQDVAFESGYWRGMRQPAFVVSVRFRRLEVRAAALRRFDAIVVALFPAGDAEGVPALIQAAQIQHPVLQRLLRLSLHVLQRMGMPVMGAGRAIQPDAADARQWRLALPAIGAEIGAPRAAWALACQLMNVLAAGGVVAADVLSREADKLVRLWRPAAPGGVNTLRFLQAAHELGIPWRHVANNVYQFGWGRRARWLDSSFTDETSTISAGLARDKVACAKVLREAGLPVPRHHLVASVEQAVAVADALGYPVVVKPANLDGGAGVFAGVRDAQAVRQAFDAVSKLSKRVLVEQFVEGNDYRVRVCKGAVVGVVIRRAAAVLGDGVHTVRELIDITNRERSGRTQAPAEQAEQAEQGIKPIRVDEEVLQWLAAQQLHIDSIVALGQRVRLRGAANVSLGGTTWDVTQGAHPDNLDLAVRAAATLRLDVAGVDLLLPDIARSWRQTGAAVCEVNGQPQFSVGPAHRKVLQRLVVQQGRIPVVGLMGLAWNEVMAQAIVEQGAADGLTVCVATTSEQCRRALCRADVDAIVWQIPSNPTVQEDSLPVDRLSLLIQAAGAEDFHTVFPKGDFDSLEVLTPPLTAEAVLDRLRDGRCPTAVPIES